MIRSFKAFCFLFTITVALFVIVNVVVADLYPRHTRAPPKNSLDGRPFDISF